MVYGPHILEKRVVVVTRDSYNRTAGESVSWEKVGACRCDDNSTYEVKDQNGQTYVPRYHIVSDRHDIKAGDYVRAMDGNTVRGEGEVRKVIKTNYLDYMSIYV